MSRESPEVVRNLTALREIALCAKFWKALLVELRRVALKLCSNHN